MAKKITGTDGKVYVEKKPFYKRWWFIALIIIVLIGAIGSQGGNKDTDKTDTTNKNTKQAETKAKEPTTKVNYDNFLAIKLGSTVQDVNALLGIEGKEQSDISGTKTFEWKDKGLKYVHCVVDNGIITSKSQVGLKEVNHELTAAMYDQIQEGMTYDQVKQIVGVDGAIFSEIELLGTISTDYNWTGKKLGQNMNVMIQNGAVTSKSQNGLE